MRDKNDIENRVLEIERFVQFGDMRSAINRLLDLSRDYSISKKVFQKVISLSARHNTNETSVLNNIISFDNYHSILNTLIIELLDLSQEIANTWENNKNSKHKHPLIEILKIENANLKYPNSGFRITNLGLNITSGTITGIFGPNANGKTSICKIISGDLEVQSGKLGYLINGRLLEPNRKNWAIIKRYISYVPQALQSWYGNYSVKTLLSFEASVKGIYRDDNKNIVNFFIQRLNLSEYSNRYWSELSSGYRLKFAIARALVTQPKLLILDEPLANLDIPSRVNLIRDLRNLADSPAHPMGVVITSQDVDMLELVADKILYVENGHSKYYGSPRKYNLERKTNIFEIQVKQDYYFTSKILSEMNLLEFDFNEYYYVVRCPISLNASELLNTLVEKGVSIIYFRDISASVRKELQAK